MKIIFFILILGAGVVCNGANSILEDLKKAIREGTYSCSGSGKVSGRSYPHAFIINPKHIRSGKFTLKVSLATALQAENIINLRIVLITRTDAKEQWSIPVGFIQNKDKTYSLEFEVPESMHDQLCLSFEAENKDGDGFREFKSLKRIKESFIGGIELLKYINTTYGPLEPRSFGAGPLVPGTDQKADNSQKSK